MADRESDGSMTLLELRLIAYGILFLGIVGASAWGSYVITSHHYERVMQAERLAQDAALQTHQAKAIADLQAQQAATTAAEKQFETLKAISDGLSQRLADSVSNYASLRGSVLSTATSAAALANAARQGAQRDSQLAGLVRQAVAACE